MSSASLHRNGYPMNLLRRIRLFACLALLAALIGVPSLQIVLRGLFNIPMSGAEELARYFLITLTMLGAATVTQGGGQIRMEEIQAMLPHRVRFFLQVLVEFCAVILFALMTVASIDSIAQNWENQTATLEMPYWLFMGPLTLGMFMLTLEHLILLVQTLRRGQASDKLTTLA
jgi:TRAP-type C4-dicarboxylate transport system permease small subunit